MSTGRRPGGEKPAHAAVSDLASLAAHLGWWTSVHWTHRHTGTPAHRRTGTQARGHRGTRAHGPFAMSKMLISPVLLPAATVLPMVAMVAWHHQDQVHVSAENRRSPPIKRVLTRYFVLRTPPLREATAPPKSPRVYSGRWTVRSACSRTVLWINCNRVCVHRTCLNKRPTTRAPKKDLISQRRQRALRVVKLATLENPSSRHRWECVHAGGRTEQFCSCDLQLTSVDRFCKVAVF